MKTKSMIVQAQQPDHAPLRDYRTRRVPLNLSATITQAWVATQLGYTPPLTTAQQFTVNQTVQLQIAKQRLNALHELMRFELPEAWTDVIDTPQTVPRPALSQAYLNAYNTNFATATATQKNSFLTYENAETLYMIVTLGFVDELGGRDLFNESSIGDTDSDGFPEFIDAWNTPIRFLRWAPGFTLSELNGAGGSITASSGGMLTITNVPATPSSTYSYGMSKVNNAYAGKQITIYSLNGGSPVVQSATITSSTYTPGATPLIGGVTTLYLATTPTTPPAMGDYFGIDLDPFNPLGLDPNQTSSTNVSTTHVSFAIYPLIYSAGPDKVYSIVSENGLANGGIAAAGSIQHG